MKLKCEIILYAMLLLNCLAVVSCEGNKSPPIQGTSLVHVHLGEMVKKPGMYWIDPQASFWEILKRCGGSKINNGNRATILGGVTVWRKEKDGTLLVRKWWAEDAAPEIQTVQKLLKTERQGRWKICRLATEYTSSIN